MKKSVSFLKGDTHEIPGIDHLTKDVITKCWLQSSDHDAIKADLCGANALICEKRFKENDCFTIRGLEYLIPEERPRRREAISKALQVVLKEQSRQRLENIHNPDVLAEISRDHTKYSKDIAYSAGLEDEKSAKRQASSDEAKSKSNEVTSRKKTNKTIKPNSRSNAQRQLAKLRALREKGGNNSNRSLPSVTPTASKIRTL